MDENIRPSEVHRCPNCNRPMTLMKTCQQTGTALGAGIGCICGYISNEEDDSRLASALTGFFAGAAAGGGIGKVLDDRVISRYHCHHCNITLKF